MLTAFKGSLWGHSAAPGTPVPQMDRISSGPKHDEVPPLPGPATVVVAGVAATPASTNAEQSSDAIPSLVERFSTPPCDIAVAAEEDTVTLHRSVASDTTWNAPEEAHSPEQWYSPAVNRTITFIKEEPPQFPQESLQTNEISAAPPSTEAPVNIEFKVSDASLFLTPQQQSPIADTSPTQSSTSSSTDFALGDLPKQQLENQFVTNIEIDTDGDDQFQPAQNFQFAASDFDFLLSKGGVGDDQAVDGPRDSLLLKFDPLLKAAPLISSQRLSVTREETPEEVGAGELEQLPDFAEGSEDGVIEINSSSNPPPPIIVETAPAAEDGEGKSPEPQQQQQQQSPQESGSVVGELGGGGVLLTGLETSGFIAVAAVSPYACTTDMSMNVDEEATIPQPHCADDEEADEKMSVDNTMILDGGESSCSLAERNMSYMEPDQDSNGTGVSPGSANSETVVGKKSKNESLKIEELQKKLADAEHREEALLKRITDKDKTISKMSGVVEAYERAIADLITQKEQTTQSYEKTCEALKADSDINAEHLESLEKTFSDLHAKYERMKVITDDYKEREEELVNERNRFEESLRMQEKRYENMKSHAMTQLDIANNKLADLVRNHAQEVTKLKALLKKEEIYRASVNEQLSQKSRENEELVKICEELINGAAN
ncbi:transforming acidic coiled-coil-containing protein 2 isoform X1 [Armigeres subalbatus]|uniref:transforming acidic coiled-coil-containing protein 2 isoform X1 n=1 Tax=Armigeres subalbatus TaxID=124917 RepID=UPI002ED004BD